MIYKNDDKGWKSIVKDVDEKGIITVYANSFGIEDSDEDISVKGSFKKTISENSDRVRWFLNHNKEQLLGVPIELKDDEFGLLTRGQLNMKKEISRDIYEDYKLYAEHGKGLEHSVGVTAIKRDPANRKMVTEWKLWEWSTLTHWGANPMTPVVDIKSASKGDISDMIDWLEKSLKYNYTDERFKQIEAKLKELKTLMQPGNATVEPFDAIKYLENNLKLLK